MQYSNNIRIGIAGNVDAGKSTLIGVLCNGKLDDGKGLARNSVLRSKHELETGRTTNVTINYLQYPEKNRTTSLIDLAGHEKYLKTTLFGLTGYHLHYGIVIIGANMGVNKMTKEHLSILLFLRIPIIVLITKVDIAPDGVYQQTLLDITKILKLPVFRKSPCLLNDQLKINNYLDLASQGYSKIDNITPIICVSSKTGENIDNIKKILEILPIDSIRIRQDNIKDHPIIMQSKNISRQPELETQSVNENNIVISTDNPIGTITYVDSVYQVKGIGFVITGCITGSYNELNKSIKKDQILYLGPLSINSNKDSQFIEIRVKSMHNSEKQLINETYLDDNIVMAIKYDKKHNLLRKHFHKGIVVLSNLNDQKFLSWNIRTQIKVLNSKTNVKFNYMPTLHCNTVRQPVTVTKILNENKVVQTGQIAEIEIRMSKYPVLLLQGDILYLRDGTCKSVGLVTQSVL